MMKKLRENRLKPLTILWVVLTLILASSGGMMKIFFGFNEWAAAENAEVAMENEDAAESAEDIEDSSGGDLNDSSGSSGSSSSNSSGDTDSNDANDAAEDSAGNSNDANDAAEDSAGDLNDDESLEAEKLLYIYAVNPGYKIDGISNVGEMIEVRRKDNSDAPISLAGTTVGYTNSSGKYQTLFEFPENSWMTGESLLLRLASSPESELAHGNYKKTLAFSGKISLEFEEKVIDEVCWTGAEECFSKFTSKNPTVLARNSVGDFTAVSEYEPEYIAGNYTVLEEENAENTVFSSCRGMEFSEILSYYEEGNTEQFIELYNGTTEQISLDGCKIKYKNKQYSLSGTVSAGEYFLYYPSAAGFSLTKNPTSGNEVSLVDTDGTTVDTLNYPNGQRKGTAWALIGYDAAGAEIWKTTYAPTPGEANNYQEYKSCESGKVINEATGNCVKIADVTEKICKDGYYLNLLTGRCKKVTTTETKTCKEGYELNPETNRCKKVQVNNGADYSIEPENYEESSSFGALIAVLIVVGIGVAYLIYEFRKEIARMFRKAFRKRK